MKLRFLFALLILTVGVTEELQAQRRGGPNYSLQVGGQFRFLRPVGMNYALEQFNLNNATWTTKLEEIRWTSGLSFGAGIHRGRSEIRFQVQTFGGSTFGIGPDSTSAIIRRDIRLSGATYQVGLASNLVQINRNLSFGVGGTFAINRIVLQTDAVAEGSFVEGAILPTVQTQIKPSLNLIAPINIGLGPWVGVKIEPTYQVFFAPTNYSDFSQAINGNAVSATDPSLETEADHFGITVSIIGYLFRRY